MTLYVIAPRPDMAERNAAAKPDLWFVSEQDARAYMAGYRDRQALDGFNLYAVEDGPGEHGKVATFLDKCGEALALPTLAVLAIAVWLILPGEAHAAFKEPAHVARTWADDFAALVAVLIGFSGFCLALIAVVANKLRDKARDYYGENVDGE
jgi:hypothetical protein